MNPEDHQGLERLGLVLLQGLLALRATELLLFAWSN
jgi:hypothetical protein